LAPVRVLLSRALRASYDSIRQSRRHAAISRPNPLYATPALCGSASATRETFPFSQPCLPRVRFDPKSGAIAVVELVRVGQTIQFQLRGAAASREDLQATLASLRARLNGRRPVFGCYFNCAGRGQSLYGEPDHDVALIREALGQFPLAGFFGHGELAPVGRQNFLHNYTGALLLISE
jgi:FIST C domain